MRTFATLDHNLTTALKSGASRARAICDKWQ